MGHPVRAAVAADTLIAAGHQLDRLETSLGHRFADKELLREALTHPSVLGRGLAKRLGRRSYERLEFLGDRVVGLIVVEMLMRRFPSEAEGALTKRLGGLVDAGTLAEVGRQLELHRWLDMAGGDAGDRDSPGPLADACEAVIGAVYLDGGLEPARALVSTLWEGRLEASPVPPRDAKMELQEWAQARAMALPVYRVLDTDGPAHAPRFRVEASVVGQPPAIGDGASKRAAERAAAAALLQTLKEPAGG